MIPRLVPTTVEAAVRALYRSISHDDRFNLAAEFSASHPEVTMIFMDMHRRMQRYAFKMCFLQDGNPELFADVRRKKGPHVTFKEATVHIVNRMTDRAKLDRQFFPQSMDRAVHVLEAELSVGERKWLCEEQLTEHGLLMRQLVTWCIDRFGLEKNNTVLIGELTSELKQDGQDFHPRLAARYLIEHLKEKVSRDQASMSKRKEPPASKTKARGRAAS